MNIIGYRISLTGVFGYDFYCGSEKICSAGDMVIPSPPIQIYGYGYHLSSEFDSESTLITGLARYVFDEDADIEKYKIIYRQTGEYDIVFEADSIHVEVKQGQFTFHTGDIVIAQMKRHHNGTGKALKFDDTLEPYFDVLIEDGTDELAQVAIMAFPILQFAL